MRWKYNRPIKPISPSVGDTKITRKFAIFPLVVNNEWVWLEWIDVHWEYAYYMQCYEGGGSQESKWFESYRELG